MNIAALVLGIVGLLFSLVPCLGMYAIPLTVLAVIFGAIGMKKPVGKGMAVAGLVCGLVGTAIGAYWLYAYLTLKSAAEDSIDKMGKAAAEEMAKEAAKAAKEAAREMNAPDAPADETPPADDSPDGE
jgi:hypothetical protein